jgi:hypothetical protein
MTLGELLARATPYEHWRTPLDANLARGFVLSAVALLLVAPLLWCLPALAGLTASWLLLPLGWLALPLHESLMQRWGLLLHLHSVGLILTAVVLVATRLLRAGRMLWHGIAFAQIILGATQAAILLLWVGIVLLCAALWASIAITMLALLGLLPRFHLR